MCAQWRKYFSGKILWVTNTATAFALYTLGDFGAQLIEVTRSGEKNRARLDWSAATEVLSVERALKMGCMSLFTGPWQTGFYLIIDRRFPGQCFQIIIVSLTSFFHTQPFFK